MWIAEPGGMLSSSMVVLEDRREVGRIRFTWGGHGVLQLGPRASSRCG